MTTLHTWAIDWQIPHAALADLQRRLGVLDALDPPVLSANPGSEAAVTNAVRLEASRKGIRLWRNNVGALIDARGVPVRFGLANDTPALNKLLKSADYVGWRPVRITQAHVGGTVAVFLSVEMKEEGWRYTATVHEQAQQRWAELVIAGGGEAIFANREGLL